MKEKKTDPSGYRPKVKRPRDVNVGTVSPLLGKDNKWRFRWRISRTLRTGKTDSLSGIVNSEKKAWDRIREARTRVGNPRDIRSRGWTVQTWCEHQLDPDNAVGESIEPSTRYFYKLLLNKHVYPELGHIPLNQLDPQFHIDPWRKKLKAKLPNSWEKSECALRVCLEEGVSGMFDSNPVGRRRRTRKKRNEERRRERERLDYLSLKSIAKTLREVQGSRLEGPILCALFEGVRRGEICGLKHDALELGKMKVHIERQLYPQAGEGDVLKAPKWGSSGTIKLSEPLAEWYRNSGRHTTFVFTNEKGKPISPRRLSEAVREFFDRIGVTCEDGSKATLQKLRRSWNTHAQSLEKEGITRKDRMGVARHRTESAHARYESSVPEREAKAIDLMTDMYLRASEDLE